MNILLDTHAVIWFITDNPNLPAALKKVIEDDSNKCYVSLATHWEMSIKYSLDRLELSGTLDNIFEIIEASGFEILPITVSHILTTATLAYHHRDPFDRMLIGQAIYEGMKLMTKDSLFGSYEVEILWEK